MFILKLYISYKIKTRITTFPIAIYLKIQTLIRGRKQNPLENNNLYKASIQIKFVFTPFDCSKTAWTSPLFSAPTIHFDRYRENNYYLLYGDKSLVPTLTVIAIACYQILYCDILLGIYENWVLCLGHELLYIVMLMQSNNLFI